LKRNPHRIRKISAEGDFKRGGFSKSKDTSRVPSKLAQKGARAKCVTSLAKKGHGQKEGKGKVREEDDRRRKKGNG